MEHPLVTGSRFQTALPLKIPSRPMYFPEDPPFDHRYSELFLQGPLQCVSLSSKNNDQNQQDDQDENQYCNAATADAVFVLSNHLAHFLDPNA